MAALEFGLLILPTPRPGNTIPQMRAANARFLGACVRHDLTAWFVDHFQFDDRPYLECFSMLAHAAGANPGLRVGTLVLGQGYRNPAVVAKIAASIAHLQGGDKLILGIGAGWKQDEYAAYGFPFPSARERIEQLDEAAQIIRKLWTESPASFVGRHYRIEHAHCEPRPEPQPLLMIGGGGEQRTLRVAAQHADWWNVDYIGPDDYARKVGILRRNCEEIGRDPDAVTPTYFGMISVSRDESQVVRTPPPNYPPNAVILSGTPSEVIEKIARFQEIGARHIQLVFMDYPRTDSLELFLSDVLPAFANA